MAGFLAFLEEPTYAEKIQPDEQTLLDMDKHRRALHRRARGVHPVKRGRSPSSPAGRRASAPPPSSSSATQGAHGRRRRPHAGDGIVALDVTDEAAVDAARRRHRRRARPPRPRRQRRRHVRASTPTSPTRRTDEWRRTMAVNLDGVYFCLRAELRASRRRRRPSSTSPAPAGRMGVPGLAAYSASASTACSASPEVGGPRGRPHGRAGQLRVPRHRPHADAARLRRRRRGRCSRRWAARRRWAASASRTRSPRPSSGCCPTPPAS